MLFTDSNPDWASDLSEDDIRERKSVLDASYCYLQIAMEEISMYLKEKYPEDMKKKHNKINF
jgi:hypothetical protein